MRSGPSWRSSVDETSHASPSPGTPSLPFAVLTARSIAISVATRAICSTCIAPPGTLPAEQANTTSPSTAVPEGTILRAIASAPARATPASARRSRAAFVATTTSAV